MVELWLREGELEVDNTPKEGRCVQGYFTRRTSQSDASSALSARVVACRDISWHADASRAWSLNPHFRQ